MKLTLDNYFSFEADKEYLSVSQYKAFKNCEFSAHAQYVTGDYERPVTDALLVGSYVDAYFAGTLEAWKEEHPEILISKKTLKAPFAGADVMIARIERDELFMSCMQGLKQQILTPVLNGVKWKCLPDFVNVEDSICYDLKTTKSFAPEWSAKHRQKVPFYEVYNYFLQLAVYHIALQQKYEKLFDMVICAVTKEKTPDIKILDFSDSDCQYRMNSEIQELYEYQQFIVKIKAGKVPAEELRRCEDCEYCRQTKKLTSFEPAIVI